MVVLVILPKKSPSFEGEFDDWKNLKKSLKSKRESMVFALNVKEKSPKKEIQGEKPPSISPLKRRRVMNSPTKPRPSYSHSPLTLNAEHSDGTHWFSINLYDHLIQEFYDNIKEKRKSDGSAYFTTSIGGFPLLLD